MEGGPPLANSRWTDGLHIWYQKRNVEPQTYFWYHQGMTDRATITFQTDAATKAALQELANRQGRSLSNWLDIATRALVGAADTTRQSPPISAPENEC